MTSPRLIVTAGLPGAGKSCIAEGLARGLGAAILAVDPIEAAMWRAGLSRSSTGMAAYGVAAALARENLQLGRSVVVDAVNPIEAPRAMWRALAGRLAVALTFVECLCSDREIHRRRIEARVRGIDGMPETTWVEVETRRAAYEPWAEARLLLETSATPIDALVARASAHLDGA